MDTTRSLASSGSPYEGSVGFSRAVRVGQHIAVSGTAPINADGHVSMDPAQQTRRCWEIALGALAELGGRPEDVIRTRHFITDHDVIDAVSTVHGEIFGEIRREPGVNHRHPVSQPDRQRFQCTHRTRGHT